jgi:hypothetical protein
MLHFDYLSGANASLTESFAIGSANTSYILTGNINNENEHQRGTIYATIDFMERVGLRFLDSTSTVMTRDCPWVSSPSFNSFPKFYTYSPPLEYRRILGWDVTRNNEFAQNLFNNGQGQLKVGGGTIYADPPGFVHTSYKLLDPNAGNIPPPEVYSKHPEWFWGGNASYGQLCWSNKSLVEAIKTNVLQYLTDQPDATVISISQNDNFNYCNTSSEREIYNDEGGSLIGPILRAVNEIADEVKKTFPNRDIAIDTLAYQWTRAAPTKTYPRKNVIIRLCSIECNFGAPLSDPSNAKFQTDIINWGKFSQRTWIWNYATDFANYVMPWPDCMLFNLILFFIGCISFAVEAV